LFVAQEPKFCPAQVKINFAVKFMNAFLSNKVSGVICIEQRQQGSGTRHVI
jgi:hypothetical protein